MRALRKLDASATLTLCEVAAPAPGRGQVLLDVAACGICGTDLHILANEYRSSPPVTLGHEIAGTVAALGPGVEGWEVGQRVVTETYASTCGRCGHCRAGRPNLCPERRSLGSMVDGGFADRVAVPATNLHALPDALPFPEAALIEPLACVVRGLLELGAVRAGDAALITGPGPIGLLALQVARAAGAEVVVAGTADDAARLELARRLGADVVTVTGTPEADAAAARAALGRVPEVVIECSGAGPAAALLLAAVAAGGRYVQVGLYGAPVPFDADVLCLKELVATGSFATVPSSWETAVRLAAGGRVALAPLVGATYPLEAWREAFAAVRGRAAGKVLFVP